LPGDLTKARRDTWVVGSPRPLSNDGCGSVYAANPIVDFGIVRHEEKPCRETNRLALQPPGSAFAVPLFMTLSNGFSDCRTDIEQVAYLQCHVATDGLRLRAACERRRQDLSGAPQRAVAFTDLPQHEGRDFDRPAGITKDDLFAKSDIILEELCEGGALDSATHAAEQRDIVGAAEVIAVQP
jgi:hypothetical protein